MAFGMTNPVLKDKNFQPTQSDLAPGWGAPARPAGSERPAPPRRYMTVGGTIRNTAFLWLLILASGAFGWSQVSQTYYQVNPRTGQLSTFPPDTPQRAIDQAVAQGTAVLETRPPGWLIFVMIGAIACVFVAVFKPRTAPFLSPVYALGYGAVLGAISAIYNAEFDGIVVQAVLATLAVFGAMLFLYASRIIKVTRKFAMVVIGATFGIMLMYLAGFLLSFFGVNISFWNQPTPLGIGVSVFICVIAALNLTLDFAFIENASQRELPTYVNWVGALGLTVTIVWLYLEILRLLALLRR